MQRIYLTDTQDNQTIQVRENYDRQLKFTSFTRCDVN